MCLVQTQFFPELFCVTDPVSLHPRSFLCDASFHLRHCTENAAVHPCVILGFFFFSGMANDAEHILCLFAVGMSHRLPVLVFCAFLSCVSDILYMF